MKSVLLYSGGMDSFIINYIYKPDILLYIDINQPYQKLEIELIRKWMNESKTKQELIVFDLKIPDFCIKNGHVPLRNVFFIEIASLFGDVVYLGALKGETSRDKTKSFRRSINRFINYQMTDPLMLKSGKKIKVVFPLKNLTKTQALKKYLDLGGTMYDLTEYTISCYSEDGWCGECMSCFRRYVAEINNDVFHFKYKKDPFKFIEKEVNRSFIWKLKQIFRKEFWINLPSNIDYLKAKKKWDFLSIKR